MNLTPLKRFIMKLQLKAKQVHSFKHRHHTQVQVQAGVAWITSNQHQRDVFLAAGETYVLAAKESILMENASSIFELYIQACPNMAPQGYTERLQDGLRRWRSKPLTPKAMPC
jgi:hypothetical protein